MKKQTVYQVMVLEKRRWVVEKQGYLYDVVFPEGTITIGLVYKRPYWFATHYESGLDCTPYSDAGGYQKAWKNKDNLLEAVKTLNFYADGVLEQAKPFIDLVNKYKEACNHE